MRQWEVKSVYGEQEVQDLLNAQEQNGWSLFYFWINAETMNFICFFYKELEGYPCKKPDMSSQTGPSG